MTMGEAPMKRMLELVKRELGASDARAEFGGEPPRDRRILYVDLPKDWRIVAIFDEPPERPKEVLMRLRQLSSAFFEVGPNLPRPNPDGERHWVTRRLDDELCTLAARANAVGALVIDYQSPVFWGFSEPRFNDESVEEALEWASWEEELQKSELSLEALAGVAKEGLEELLNRRVTTPSERQLALRLWARLQELEPTPRHTRIALYRAASNLRARADGQAGPPSGVFRDLVRNEGFGYVARSFASIYVAAIVFDRKYSELHAEAALLHALPVVERLVLALPPVEPPPKGGRVVKFPVPSRTEG
jgi:hypothetical protein